MSTKSNQKLIQDGKNNCKRGNEGAIISSNVQNIEETVTKSFDENNVVLAIDYVSDMSESMRTWFDWYGNMALLE